MNIYDTAITHRNAEATSDLILPVSLEPTVSQDESKQNAILNSRLAIPWVDEVPAHDGVAIIAGAAPSLCDTLEDIRKAQAEGGTLFACNRAALVCSTAGINIDSQVILDPHPRAFLDMFDADKHYLASICDPTLFKAAKNPVLWHPLMPWIEECVEEEKSGFTCIGGGITVSNSAVCLVYTLGYRKFHIHGMDSSYFEGKSHSYQLKAIEGILLVTVEHNGKQYKTSYDMKQQLVVFIEIHRMLKDLGCEFKIHGHGLLPDYFNYPQQEN